MSQYSGTFDWIDFPGGRVRYAGGSKGRDEPPITIFSVELNGRVFFGEFGRSFLANDNDYNIEVVSFGWLDREWFGTEPDPKHCTAFRLAELGDVQSLICQAVPVWRSLEDRPSIVREYSDSHFGGEILFRKGWALVADGEDRV
ncbi:hypothetical protein [Luteibacter sp. 3190]|uniref:hypothetical protein n=1 Tax=Luteibacter sp. 3190 TaxID=2817736 RepID=UPI00286475C9|nr:hypothetical protein [Luteibacter sp. 3190]MDR6938326.1 hypothetical protein [Luteibacter sp. 3190]